MADHGAVVGLAVGKAAFPDHGQTGLDIAVTQVGIDGFPVGAEINGDD